MRNPEQIVHVKQLPYDVYIGREYDDLPASKWGNPFKIGKDGTREEVIAKYEQYLVQNYQLMESLNELRGKTLGCWCKTKENPDCPCHGDILVKHLYRPKTIGIIGTAGRGTDAEKLNISTYNSCIRNVREVIDRYTPTALVSGGAAWADHIAVGFYLAGRVNDLFLHLPAHFSTMRVRFDNNNRCAPLKNPAQTANFYHQKFSEKCKIDSLGQIYNAFKNGAVAKEYDGFFERNTEVAKQADIMIACTFGDKEHLKDGGTADTMKKYFVHCEANNKPKLAYHYDFNTQTMYRKAVVE
jgi:hypothetical protein